MPYVNNAIGGRCHDVTTQRDMLRNKLWWYALNAFEL